MKDLKYMPLFDAYGALLTENRRELCELYYMCDLSLTEIAEQKGISKQSVSDTLAKCRSLLEEYEEKLRVVQTGGKLVSIAERVAAFSAAHPEFSEELNEILVILKEN